VDRQDTAEGVGGGQVSDALIRLGLQHATDYCIHTWHVGPALSLSVASPCPHAVTDMGDLCAGHQSTMKPAQLLQLAESIAAKQVAQAQASGKTPSQDCVLLHCALLQVSAASLLAPWQAQARLQVLFLQCPSLRLLAAVVNPGSIGQ